MWAALFGLMLVCSTMILPSGFSSRPGRSAEDCVRVSYTVESNIDIAVAGHFHRADAFNGAEIREQLRRDRFGRLFQLPCELKGYRYRQFAKGRLLRLFEHDWHFGSILFPNVRGDAPGNVFLDRVEHKSQYKNVP